MTAKKQVRKKADQKAGSQKNTAENKSDRKIKSADFKGMTKKSFPVVGIGASAGGLEAIEGFLSSVKLGCNMAFVIIQHRATESKSIMVSLLKKYTDLEVTEIEENVEVRPECIYLNPPHKDVIIEDGWLCCGDFVNSSGTRLPIDYFFRSLAKDQEEHSICIILSGTGTDGTLGLKEIKAAGGMAMVQQEKQAKYSSMPRSAIDTGLVDFVLPVERMQPELLKYVKHPYLKSSKKPLGAEDKFENTLQQMFRLVRTVTGHDFSNYKRNTIRRRVERRMAVHQIPDVKEYIRFLRENTAEIKTLFKDMIITVTNFFRDPQAFEALKEKAIKEILRNKPLNSNLRIWIPGCATGEEAYTIAILFEEAMEELEKKHDIQIFATDIDEDAIEAARNGRYPDSISTDVSKKRLKRFFSRFDNSYKINEQIRDMLIFAKQDLIKDPPFSKLDMICCRNVLIYMNSELQKRIIPLFHYVLGPQGYLFLGTSETIGQFSDLFSPVDNKQKIFERKPHTVKRYEHPSIPLSEEFGSKSPTQDRQQKREAEVNRLAEKLILTEYSLPCVLVNEEYDIVYFNGDTGMYLSQPGGEPTTNILKMIKQELHYTLSVLLHKAEREEKTVKSKNLQIKSNGDVLPLNLIIVPVRDAGTKGNFLMVVFDTKAEAGKPSKKGGEKSGSHKNTEPHIEALEQELTSTKEYLQTTIEELETSNEELKSSNEELQSTNEELQSTNEELETSREELQSTNEELRIVNTEHQVKIEELARANDDLNNLLSSTNIATIFLDTELKIKRFTPESKSLFKFIDTDAGRPLDNIVNKLEYEKLEEDAKKVLDTLTKVEREVKTRDETWLRVQIAPYRTIENVIDGVVITAFDISREKESQQYAESIVETVRQPLLVMDKDLKVISANPAFYRNFKAHPEETEGKFVYDIGNRQWDIPELRELLEEILPKDTSFEDFEVEHEFPTIGKRKMILNGRRILQKAKETQQILLAIEDVTKSQ